MSNRSQRITAWLFRNHRWFGIAPCLFVMTWGLSGVLHPVMSRLSPQAAATQAPQTQLAMHTALPPSDVLAKANIDSISALRVVSMNGVSYYQATASAVTPAEAGAHPEKVDRGQAAHRYFNINTGDELANGDSLYAQFLARHFAGDKTSPIKAVTLITQFDDDYLSVNRLLPVYRVDFERADGLRVYIETNPGRAAAFVDNTKATLGLIFNFMHTWVFMSDAPTLRKVLITLLLGTTFLSAVSGVWIYGFMFKRKTLSASHAPLRRWHRTTAIVVSISTVCFTVSGMWHLWSAEPRATPTINVASIPSQSVVFPDSVRHGNWSSLSSAQFDGRLYFDAQPFTGAVQSSGVGEHDHHDHPVNSEKPASSPAPSYIDANTGIASSDLAKQRAIALANQYSQSPESVNSAQLLTRFTNEYGFINKRLPVWQVDYEGGKTYYIETSSGALASVVDNADRAEGYSFAFLHKYHWLDFAGKNARDIVSAFFALGNAIVAALGFWMFVRRYTKKAIS